MISVNLLLDEETRPVVWRGPVIAGTVKQFWTDVIWGELEYLLIDMPPGTGDIHISLLQDIPVNGAVIVTTPQKVALADVENSECGDIPADLRDSHYSGAKKLGHGTGYKYPHSYPGHYVKQQYLPTKIKDAVYYVAGDNKTEQAAKKYWDAIKNAEKKQKTD